MTGDKVEKIETFDKCLMPKAHEDAIKEVGDVPQEIKNLFTYEFARRLDNSNDFRQKQIFAKSNNSLGLETITGRIIDYTYKIRKGRKLLREEPNHVGIKVCVNIWSTKRLKYLIELKKFDGEEYKKLLEKLEIEEPRLVMGEIKHNRITRKQELRRLTKEYCDNLINKRLDAYRLKLEEQQKIFEKDKAEFDEWMHKMMKELNIDESQLETN